MRRLPPLEALRVFEAAARLASFKDAASELNVTAGAVSHRISALEQELGVPLFVRHTRRIELTADGERLAAGMRRALGEIRRAVTSIDRREGARLRITAIPSHVTRWLAPRLPRFQRTHPDIELSIGADLGLADLAQRSYDVALRFGAGSYPGLHVEELMDDAIVPVASAGYVTDHGPIERPADILRLTRIFDVTAEDDGSGANWRSYLERIGLPGEPGDRSLSFNGAVITLEAAAAGLGVAIGRLSLVADELRTGRLVKILPTALPTHWKHYALMLPDMAAWPPGRSFVDWLRVEADQFAAVPSRGGDLMWPAT